MTPPCDSGTVLVGYDGSAASDVALRWAAETAALQGFSVLAIMVDREGGDFRPEVELAADDMSERVDVVLAAYGVVGVAERRSGQVILVLLREARHAAMLVVGSQGHGWATATVRGSVSQYLARHAPCPVVVARPSAHAGAARIIVGADGSEPSRAALDFACRRAEASNESVVAVHAWRPGRANVDGRGQLSGRLAERSHAADLALSDYVADLKTLYPDVTIEQEAIAVTPARALADTSVHASLVVTGSRGRSVLNGLLLGSVSHHLLHSARCSVAVIR